MKRSDLEKKSLQELKAIASVYGLSEVDLWGNSHTKSVWIKAILHAQTFEVQLTNTDQAIHRCRQWISSNNTEKYLLIKALSLQKNLNISKPAFWFALYALRDEGYVQFDEPNNVVLEISKND